MAGLGERPRWPPLFFSSWPKGTIVFIYAPMPLSFWRKIGSDWRVRALATLALFGAGAVVARLDLARTLEWKAEDARLRVRAKTGAKPHAALCLLGIDEKSIEDFGQWPFARTYHGQFLEWLQREEAARPAVMAWDLLFVDPGFDWQWDQFFADGLRGVKFPVVLGSASDIEANGLVSNGSPKVELAPLATISEQPGLASLPDQKGGKLPLAMLLEAGARPAFLDASADADGVIRRVPLVVRIGNAIYPSLILRTLMDYWKVDRGAVEIRPGEELFIRRPEGAVRVPVDEMGRYVLNYRHEHGSGGNKGGVPTFGYSQVYDSLQKRFA